MTLVGSVPSDIAPPTEPIPQIMRRPLRLDTFGSLGIRTYRPCAAPIVTNTAA